jgi:hypothetical protein
MKSIQYLLRDEKEQKIIKGRKRRKAVTIKIVRLGVRNRNPGVTDGDIACCVISRYLDIGAH